MVNNATCECNMFREKKTDLSNGDWEKYISKERSKRRRNLTSFEAVWREQEIERRWNTKQRITKGLLRTS